MDKEEFRIKLDEINHLVEAKDYKGAMEVVDSIDWRRVKNVRTLCVVGEIYAANKRYEDSRDIFLLAYHRASIGKNILVRLIEVSLKMGEIDEATDYYEEFCSVAPNDNTAYILRYKILKEKNAPLEDQIQILEEYKNKEFTEKWSYELAKLYYRAGQKEKCEELCNEMILWFSDGNYVMKAYELKMRMGVITDQEKEKLEKAAAQKEKAKALALQKQKEAEEAKAAEKKEEEKEKEKEKEEQITEPVIEEIEVVQAEEPVSPVDSVKDEDNEKEPEDFEGNESESETGDEESEESTPEEETEEKNYENDTEEAVFDDGSPVIESIRVRNNKDLEGTETLQEKIAKGLRSLFGGKTKSESTENEENEEDEDIQEEGAADEPDEEIVFPESDEIIEEPEEASEDTSENSEKETAEETSQKEKKKREFKFRIPRSMRRNKKEEEKEPEDEEEKEEQSEEEIENQEASETEEVLEEEKEEFNLEDTILAAAFAQGIEIPGAAAAEEKEKEPVVIEETINSEAEKSISIEKNKKSQSSEDEDDQLEDVPDLIMPDLSSLLDEESDDEELSKETDEKTSLQENNDFVAEIVEGENEEDEEDEEFLVSGVISEEEIIEEEYEEDEDYSEEEKIDSFITSLQPDDTYDQASIIPRNKELNNEEIKLFSYFVKVPGMKEQIVDALYDVQIEASNKNSNTGNIIVMGGPESGKTRLISGLIPAICKELRLEASKVAYVFAEQINGKSIEKIISRLSGGFLVIERANQLDQETAVNLTKAMEGDTQGMIFIMEDDKIGMRKMMARYPKLAKKFTSVINIPVFTNDELANFAKIYAMENGYRIDDMGMIALYNLISINQKEDMPMNIGAVKEIVDSAISKSKGGLKLFRKNADKKRMDQDGFIILYDKDFIKGK